MKKACLILSDGSCFEGKAFGYCGQASGEVVFNTSMTGYQEVITDPSYLGQIVTFTYPHIGNTGINWEDMESSRIYLSGIVIQQLDVASNWRSQKELNDYLHENKIVGIEGIDTRALTIHLRSHGAMPGLITTELESKERLIEVARALPTMNNQDLVSRAGATKSCDWPVREGGHRKGMIVLIDYGCKYNIIRNINELGFDVKVVSPRISADEILALSPAGVLLSNGPGDPAAVTYGIECIRGLLGRVPIFGICLGHQLLALALGARTTKLKFGHRGINHPVKDLQSGRIMITSQNHGFVVEPDSLPETSRVTHTSLYDGTVEGIAADSKRAFSVQFHPEAAAGPHDARGLFGEFIKMLE